MHEILTSYMVVKSNAGTRNGKDKGLVCILIPKGSYVTLSASPSFLDILAFCSSDMSFSSTMASNNWREKIKSNQLHYKRLGKHSYQQNKFPNETGKNKTWVSIWETGYPSAIKLLTSLFAKSKLPLLHALRSASTTFSGTTW